MDHQLLKLCLEVTCEASVRISLATASRHKVTVLHFRGAGVGRPPKCQKGDAEYLVNTFCNFTFLPIVHSQFQFLDWNSITALLKSIFLWCHFHLLPQRFYFCLICGENLIISFLLSTSNPSLASESNIADTSLILISQFPFFFYPEIISPQICLFLLVRLYPDRRCFFFFTFLLSSSVLYLLVILVWVPSHINWYVFEF